MSAAPAANSWSCLERSIHRPMRLEDSKLRAAIAELGVEHQPAIAMSEYTSLGIGGTTDLLLIKRHESIPGLLRLLDDNRVPHRFLGGGSNLLVGDGELPWIVLQLAKPEPEIVLDGKFARVEGLIGVPGTVGGALRMNAGAYGMQIGSYVREVKLYRAAARKIEILSGDQISFEYRHTSFAPDDMMLAVTLELPSKSYQEIIQGIRICNEKRRASQPLGQKSAGCIFKNPPGASAGRMIDELGLKGFNVGDARVSDRHANFVVNAGRATAKDMLSLITEVRERVEKVYGVKLENEVVVWNA